MTCPWQRLELFASFEFVFNLNYDLQVFSRSITAISNGDRGETGLTCPCFRFSAVSIS
ncbi:MAG: hypothetical protein QXL27_09590 [Candidatus Bathyarchaeia archaeon]